MTRYIAFSIRHDHPVIAARSITAMDRIIREGEFDRSDLILCEAFDPTFTLWRWTPQQIELAAKVFSINRHLAG